MGIVKVKREKLLPGETRSAVTARYQNTSPSAAAEMSGPMEISKPTGMSDLELGWRFRNAAEALEHPSIDTIAKCYSVSPRTVRRKIRLTYLVPQLFDLAKKLGCSQRMLLDLSYLTPVQQINVVEAAVIEGLSLTAPLAATLRARAEKGSLTIDEILSLCRQFSGQPPSPADSAPTHLSAATPNRPADAPPNRLADPAERRKKHTAGDRAKVTADKDATNNASAEKTVNTAVKKYAVDDALFPPDLPVSCRESYIAAALRSFRKTSRAESDEIQKSPLRTVGAK